MYGYYCCFFFFRPKRELLDFFEKELIPPILERDPKLLFPKLLFPKLLFPKLLFFDPIPLLFEPEDLEDLEDFPLGI